MCADARANVEHEDRVLFNEAYKKDSPYKRTGVKELCPLSFLPLFNIVWDMLPDMMHIIPALMKGHIMPMMRGLRYPSEPKMRKSWSALDNKQLFKDWTKVKAQLKDWTISKVHQRKILKHQRL